MGLEHLKAHQANAKLERLSVPPGFVSLTSFTLKRMENEEATCGTMASGSASEIERAGTEVTSTIVDAATLKSSLKCRPWILYDQSNQNQEESDLEQLDLDLPSKTCLPKGVINGCPECSGCVKVIARWRPENARTEFLEDAPVFHPTEEEFSDTVKYIASIRPRAEPYGICRIVPPSSWQPPCAVKEKNGGSKFVTNLQRIDGRQNQYSKNKVGTSYKTMSSRRKRRLRMGLGYRFYDGFSRNLDEVGSPVFEDFDSEPGPKFSLEAFKKYGDSFKQQYFCRTDKVMGSNDDSPSVESIEGEYRRIIENPTEEIEVLYGSDLKADVLGSGFSTVPSSEDPSNSQDYLRSGWNLNNTPRLPASLLCFESCDTSGILVPRLHVGMCFSSIGWNVEDHHLYSLSYMHFGDPKVRYAIPGKYAIQVDVALKKHFPNLWVEQPGLRHKLVVRLPLSVLKSEGITVYRCVQKQGEFVLVFPGAYHSGFDCGFNCVEVVNYAPIDWLPYGQNAVELYREQRRKTSISHDKLLLGAARVAVRTQWEVSLLKKGNLENLQWKDVCGKDGILAKALKLRVKQESRRREYLCTSLQLQKMDTNFDATSKRECCVCFEDLHLSAVGCPCSADIYSCLLHAKQLCSCAWSDKIFLFRYDISDLNVLVEAVEKKLSAVYRWVRLDMGLALHPSISKENLQTKRHKVGPSSSAEESNQTEHRFKDAATPNLIGRDSSSSIRAEIKARLLQSTSMNNLKAKEHAAAFTPELSQKPGTRRTGTRLDTFVQTEVASEVFPDSTSTSSSPESEGLLDVDFQMREKGALLLPSTLKTKICELNKEDEDVPTKRLESSCTKQNVMDCSELVFDREIQSPPGSQSNVIYLSDDD